MTYADGRHHNLPQKLTTIPAAGASFVVKFECTAGDQWKYLCQPDDMATVAHAAPQSSFNCLDLHVEQKGAA